MSGGHELEHVNWNLVKHYLLMAGQSLNVGEMSSSDSACRADLETAMRYVKLALQQFEHVATGRRFEGERRP